MLFDVIKSDLLTARRSKDTNPIVRDLLLTLVSDLAMIEKNTGVAPDDAKVVSVVQKYLSTNKEFQGFNPDEVTLAKLVTEAQVLSAYMPQQLTDEEIDSLIAGYIAIGANNIGAIMGNFNKAYAGRFDGRALSIKIKATLI